MNRQEAKEILLLYRPGTADAQDPRVGQALELARHDLELARWLEQHTAFQKAVRLKFRQIQAPEHLKVALLAKQNVVQPAFWQQHMVWLAAAALALLVLALSAVWLRPAVPDHFANFRDRMVSTALREYSMDIVTNDRPALRQAIQARGAPADYEISPGLAKLQLTGGAALVWRNHPVSMVCFDRGDKSMVFLFVMKRTAVKDPPNPQPNVAEVRNLLTASWTKGDNTYLLLGQKEAGFPRKYVF